MSRFCKSGKVFSIALLAALVLAFFVGGTFAQEDEAVERLSGQDSYENAAITAQRVYDEADEVIIVRGDDLSDGLAGNVLSGALDAPILLTASDFLPGATEEAIEDLGANEAVILGGEAAVSQEVEDELGISTRRIAGESREETAALIAEEAADEAPLADYALVVNGDAYADAMVIGSVAAGENVPILQVDPWGEGIPQDTVDAVENLGIQELYVIGGDAVVTAGEYSELGDLAPTTRISGPDRYQTSVEVAEEFFDAPDTVIFVGGTDMAEAMAGGALGAKNDAPIVYVSPSYNPDSIPERVESYFNNVAREDTKAFIVGCDALVPNVVENEITGIIGRPPTTGEAEIEEVESLTNHNDWIRVYFSESVSDINPADISIFNVEDRTLRVVEEVRIPTDGMYAHLKILTTEDEGEGLDALTDYEMDMVADGETLETDFAIPGYVRAVVDAVDVEDREIDIYKDGDTRHNLRSLGDVPDELEISEDMDVDFEWLLGREMRLWFDGDDLVKEKMEGDYDFWIDALELDIEVEISDLVDIEDYGDNDILERDYWEYDEAVLELLAVEEEIDLEDYWYELEEDADERDAVIDVRMGGESEGLDALADVVTVYGCDENVGFNVELAHEAFDFARVSVDEQNRLFVDVYDWIDGYIVVDEVDDDVLFCKGGDELDIENYVFIKDGETVTGDDLEEYDLFFFNDDVDNSIGEEGFAEVYNASIDGEIERVFSDAIEIDDEDYEFRGTRIVPQHAQFVEDESLEELDAEAAERLKEAGPEVEIFFDRAGELVFAIGDLAVVGIDHMPVILDEDIELFEYRNRGEISYRGVSVLGAQDKAHRISDLEIIEFDRSLYRVDDHLPDEGNAAGDHVNIWRQASGVSIIGEPSWDSIINIDDYPEDVRLIDEIEWKEEREIDHFELGKVLVDEYAEEIENDELYHGVFPEGNQPDLTYLEDNESTNIYGVCEDEKYIFPAAIFDPEAGPLGCAAYGLLSEQRSGHHRLGDELGRGYGECTAQSENEVMAEVMDGDNNLIGLRFLNGARNELHDHTYEGECVITGDPVTNKAYYEYGDDDGEQTFDTDDDYVKTRYHIDGDTGPLFAKLHDDTFVFDIQHGDDLEDDLEMYFWSAIEDKDFDEIKDAEIYSDGKEVVLMVIRDTDYDPDRTDYTAVIDSVRWTTDDEVDRLDAWIEGEKEQIDVARGQVGEDEIEDANLGESRSSAGEVVVLSLEDETGDIYEIKDISEEDMEVIANVDIDEDGVSVADSTVEAGGEEYELVDDGYVYDITDRDDEIEEKRLRDLDDGDKINIILERTGQRYAELILKGEMAEINPFAEPQYEVNTEVEPEEAGEVIKGAGEYEAGDTVEVEAEAAEGWEFDEWTSEEVTFEDAEALDTTFEMPGQDVTVTATFEVVVNEVIAEADPEEGGEIVKGEGEYEFGETVEVEAEAATGWVFDEWTSEEVTFEDAEALDTTFEMPDEDVTVTAVFEKDDDFYDVEVEADPEEGGEVVEGAGRYEPGDTVNVEAGAAEGWAFVEWTSEEVTFEDAEAKDTTFDMPDQDVTVTATFEAIDFEVTAEADPEEGGEVVEGAGRYEPGDTVNVEAEPVTGWVFVEWTSEEVTFEDAGAIDTTFEMPDEAVTVTAVFEKDDDFYDVEVEADPEEGGEVVEGAGRYEPGDTVNVEAEAAEEWEFIEWTSEEVTFEDAEAKDTTFDMPDQDVTVTATFEEEKDTMISPRVQNYQWDANYMYDDDDGWLKWDEGEEEWQPTDHIYEDEHPEWGVDVWKTTEEADHLFYDLETEINVEDDLLNVWLYSQDQESWIELKEPCAVAGFLGVHEEMVRVEDDKLIMSKYSLPILEVAASALTGAYHAGEAIPPELEFDIEEHEEAEGEPFDPVEHDPDEWPRVPYANYVVPYEEAGGDFTGTISIDEEGNGQFETLENAQVNFLEFEEEEEVGFVFGWAGMEETDADGDYTITDVPEGEYDITAIYVDPETEEEYRGVVEGQQIDVGEGVITEGVDIELEPF